MDPTNKTGYSIKWNGILVFSSRFVALLVGILLARLLEPEEFGLVAMVNVLIGFTTIFINAGTGSSIIQKESLSQIDLSTIFFFNLVAGLLVSLVLYFSANPIAEFYQTDKVLGVVRILAWKPFVGSLAIVQQFLMVRQIDLKKRTIAQLIGQIFAGVIGVTLAILGYGVYALVASMLGSAFISTLLYWLQSSWRPSFAFSVGSVKDIWSFSGKIFYTNVLHQIVERIDELIVGRYLSATFLGFYNRGKSLSAIPTQMIGQVLTRSFFPILSRLQKDKKRLLNYYKKQSERITWLSIPLFIVLLIAAEDLIVILLGEKWLEAVPFFRLAIMIGFFYTNIVFKVYLLNAVGKPNINLMRGLVLGPIRILLYFVPLIFFKSVDPYYLLGVSLLMHFISFVWLKYNVRSLLSLKLGDQLVPYLKYLLLAGICTVPTILITTKVSNHFYSLLLATFGFLGIYIGLLLSYNDENIRDLISKGRNILSTYN